MLRRRRVRGGVLLERVAALEQDVAACADGFVAISDGSFMMGAPASDYQRQDDEAHRRVTLTRGFCLQSTEVTQGQWATLMGSNPSHFDSCGADCPVEQVSWEDAAGYANALSVSEGLAACYTPSCAVVGGGSVYECAGYRLPTEAEWEVAARAGTTSARYGEVDDIAWYDRNAEGQTHPVGGRAPNAWGLYDMLGNVWEWTHDRYEGEYGTSAQTDPAGPSSGPSRVSRGGSWLGNARGTRAALRFRDAPAFRLGHIGFRLSRSLP